MRPMERYDLAVLGSGPAGQKAAVQAAKLGKRVALVERKQAIGGVCLHTGTIPSKTFREAVLQLVRSEQIGAARAAQMVRGEITMGEVLGRCQQVILREMEVIGQQMRRNRIDLLTGSARFLARDRILVESDGANVEIVAEKVVIATGTTPARPDGVEVDGRTVIDSDQVLSMGTLPRTLTVVGAGVIGAEYASMFAALGVEVTLIDKRETLLPFLDREISEALSYQMRSHDVTFRFGEEVAAVRIRADGLAEAELRSAKKVVSEVLLYTIGRIGATVGLGLETAGVAVDARRRIPVSADFETNVHGIYAAGDVIGFPSLAATSMYQGRHAACHAFGVAITALPHLFPFGIYAIPEISMVGKTEEELTKEGVNYEFGLARYREIARGAILGDDTGLLKLLFHAETRLLLGVHIIGTGATELVHIGQTAMALGGTIDFFVDNVFNYPTFAECYRVAALDGYNKVGPRRQDPTAPEHPPGP